MAKHLVLALSLLAFTACTTLQPLADTQPATIRASVRPGDKVIITRSDGSEQTLKVEEITADELVGIDGSKRHRVPLADIRTLSTRVMTTQDKVWTAVAIAGALGAVVVAAGGGSSGGGERDGPGY